MMIAGGVDDSVVTVSKVANCEQVRKWVMAFGGPNRPLLYWSVQNASVIRAVTNFSGGRTALCKLQSNCLNSLYINQDYGQTQIVQRNWLKHDLV